VVDNTPPRIVNLTATRTGAKWHAADALNNIAKCEYSVDGGEWKVAAPVTRLSDRPDPVPDEIWNEAARFYNESELATLVLWIAVTNVWNRLNVATRQVAGEWAKSAQAKNVMESSAASR